MFTNRRLGGNRPICKESSDIERSYHAYYILDICSGEQFLKWEDVLVKETGDVLEFVNFRNAKAYAERKQYEYEEKINNKKK